MEVGQDSYITVEQADAHIKKYYRSRDAERQRWEALEVEERETLLMTACMLIEQLPFQGRVATIGQVLAFPRLPFQYRDASSPPKDILAAQAELALWLSDDTQGEEVEKRAELQEQGVSNFSLGDLSETYSAPGDSRSLPALRSPKARRLLKKYLHGGYQMC